MRQRGLPLLQKHTKVLTMHIDTSCHMRSNSVFMPSTSTANKQISFGKKSVQCKQLRSRLIHKIGPCSPLAKKKGFLTTHLRYRLERKWVPIVIALYQYIKLIPQLASCAICLCPVQLSLKYACARTAQHAESSAVGSIVFLATAIRLVLYSAQLSLSGSLKRSLPR